MQIEVEKKIMLDRLRHKQEIKYKDLNPFEVQVAKSEGIRIGLLQREDLCFKTLAFTKLVLEIKKSRETIEKNLERI